VYEDPDPKLIERCRQGDRAAFADLVALYQRPVFNAAFWILHRVEDASDVTQAVFLRVWERFDDYDAQYRFFSWIYRIAVNEALNLRRRTEREDELDEDFDLPDGGNGNPESRLIEAQLEQRVQRALQRMSAHDRAVLMLRHYSECSYQEIGQILELDEKTVKSRLFEARRRLQSQLADLRVN